jgi:hypothetical protein
MLVSGRPFCPRRCYKQWEEGGVVPRVVVELPAPWDGRRVRRTRLRFAATHGASEIGEYDADRGAFRAWLRTPTGMRRADRGGVFDSPSLGVRFDATGETMRVVRPDGSCYPTYAELTATRAAHRQPDA